MVKRGALIIENGLGCVLPAARSLARAGWIVGIGAPFNNPRERGSRAIAHRHVIPRPEDAVEGFIDAVNAAVDEIGYDVVLPADDASVLALSLHREQVRTIVPYPEHKAVVRAIDKLELTRAAEAVDLAVPRTAIASPDEIDACALPIMVKPRLQWTPGSDTEVGELFIQRAETRDDVRRQVAEVEAAGGSAVLQEPIDGPQTAVSVVVDRDGRVVAVSQQETLCYSLANTSTRAVTVAVDEALLERIGKLVRELGWWGLANLQFLAPEHGATPRLIDVNGRFYGSIALAVAAGADLPAIWAECATGSPPATRATARPGVRFHALENDLVRARSRREGGLLRDVTRTLLFAPGAVHTLWSIRDPLPAARWSVSLSGRLARKMAKRHS